MSERITYTQAGDYLIPDLNPENQPSERPGKYGLIHLNFLKTHRKAAYSRLMLDGSLNRHLLTIDREARERMTAITNSLMKSNPLPDTTDTMALTAHRNQIRLQAEEIVIMEIVLSF